MSCEALCFSREFFSPSSFHQVFLFVKSVGRFFVSRKIPSIENSNRQIPVETSSFFSLSFYVHRILHRELQQTAEGVAALIVRKGQNDVSFIVHRVGRSLCSHG